jgi:hypothetical protein
MEEVAPASWKYGSLPPADAVISAETQETNVEAKVEASADMSRKKQDEVVPTSSWKYGSLPQPDLAIPAKEHSADVEAYKNIIEAEMENFVLKSHPQEAPAPPAKNNSRVGASSTPRTPRTPTQSTRGIRSSSRSLSADRSRPYAKIAEHSRGSLRQSRTPLATSASLLKAASLTTRPTTLRDPRQSNVEIANDACGKRVPVPTRERKQDVSNAEPEPEKSCPSTPSLQTRPQRQSTASDTGNAMSPRSKVVAAKAKVEPKAAFGRSAVGHMPRSPRLSNAAGNDKEVQASNADKAHTDPAPRSVSKVDKERARIAHAAVVAEQQRSVEEARARAEEQRRRNIAGRERARADREAARLSSRNKPAAQVDVEALENAWVDVKLML